METLPSDGLADVLRVLPPRTPAVARCVCKAWRDVIDSRTLLLPHLLPHSVRGVFVNYVDHGRPHLFARPSSSSTFPGIDGLLSFMPNDDHRDWWRVLDHCNGLVLCEIEWGSQLCVCNPTTQRWTLLSEHTAEDSNRYITCAYIAFDPTMSPHYEVFLIPNLPEKPMPAAPDQSHQKVEQVPIDGPFCLDWLFASPEGALSIPDQTDDKDQQQPVEEPSSVDRENKEPPDDDPCRFMEWPPSPWIFKVFSSSTGLWEDRSFVCEGQPMGTVEDMLLDPDEPTWRGPRQRYAVYLKGWLYVHCRGSFMARFSLSNDKYEVIKTPVVNKDGVKPYLGRLKNGVYFGMVDGDNQLRVWMLTESCRRMEWLLKYEADLRLYADHVASLPYDRQQEGSWMVEEYNNYETIVETEFEESSQCTSNSDEYNNDMSDIETQSEDRSEWDSDNDDIFTVEASGEQRGWGNFHILGFHPYKQVVFLFEWFRVACYHLNSSKIQYLGNSRPECYYRNHTNGIFESFIYTPSIIGDLLHGDKIG